jgi:uncharacterized protein (DUF58 family)
MKATATAAFGAGLMFVAGSFDVPSLSVTGIALIGLAVAASAWVALSARGAAIRREPGAATVIEDQPYRLAFTVSHRALPLPGGRIVEPLLDRPLSLDGGRARIEADARFSRRGRRTLEPATLELRDPLGISRRNVRGRGTAELLVLPRTEPVVASSARGGSDGGHGRFGTGSGGAGLEAPAVDLEIDGLRPYRQGSPATRIHWRSVARRAEMLELRLVAGADRMPMVALDSSRPHDAETLDAAVRAAASLCLHLARTSGSCSLLLAGDERPLLVGAGLDGWPRAHARLALVEPSRTMPSMRRAARASSVFWVVARSPERLPRTLAALRGTDCTLVVPAALAAGRPEFTVAGCEGTSLGVRRRRPRARAA